MLLNLGINYSLSTGSDGITSLNKKVYVKEEHNKKGMADGSSGCVFAPLHHDSHLEFLQSGLPISPYQWHLGLVFQDFFAGSA